LKGRSAFAAMKRMSSNMTMCPDMRPVMMIAFWGEEHTACAIAKSFGHMSSGKVSTLILVPCLPSWKVEW